MYTDSEGTRNGGVPEAVVEKFLDFSKCTGIEPFIEGYEQSVMIPMKYVQW